MSRILLLASLLLIAGFSSAQENHERCKAHSFSERLLQQQGSPTDLQSALPHLGSEQRGGILNVPVVVHVVWNTTAENVPTSAIMAMINEMNQDFSGSNPDISGVRASFAGSVANVGINFCLAQVDPQGNPTTGITRTQTTETWFDPDTETDDMKFAPIGKAAWNPSQYLNIWICDISSGATGGFVTLGYAYLPIGGVVGTAIDGLVIDYQYGLPVGARTATHEIGHYLGLLHTWGDDPGSCGSDDGFSDTPNTDSPTFSCANTSLVKCSNLTQYENFMDYSNCQAMYTHQQRSYMRGVLNGVRSSLLNSAACGDVAPGACIPTSANGTADGDYINGVQLGSINNTNSGSTSGPTYTDYTGTWATSLQQGTAYSISIQSGAYFPNHYAAWIDYDQNNVFDASEKLGEFESGQEFQTSTINFTVPAGALTGTTVMRVRGVYHNTGEPTPTDPCYDYGFGETEDYGITILSGGLCIPEAEYGTEDGDFINGVSLGTITNTNSGGVTAPTYSDFSSLWSTTLQQGSTHTLTIQGGDYAPDNYAAWIDFDQDGLFEGGEKLGEFITTNAGESQTITFTVPAGATVGTTRMRVRGVYHNQGEPTPTAPCYSYQFGETEDYGIQITPAGNSGYCIPTSAFGSSDGDLINSVVLGDISNLNTGSEEGPTYNDYTLHSTTLVPGQPYTIIIEGGDYFPDSYAAWIDLNMDEVFSPNEKLGEFETSSSYEMGSIPFTIPVGTSLGATRLRIRCAYLNDEEPAPTDPCFDYTYGETEDYTVVIDMMTAVNDLSSADIRVYPNPASDRVTIEIPDGAGAATIRLVDPLGRVINSIRTAGGTHVLPLAGIAAGHYLLQIEQAGAISTHRLEVMGGN